MLFPIILFCLEEDFLPHVIRWSNKQDGFFKIRFLHKNNKKWNSSYLVLFEILDGVDDMKFQKYLEDSSYHTNSKGRCRSNFRKFITGESPYVTFVKELKDFGTIKEYKLTFPVSEIPSMLAKLSMEEKENIRNKVQLALNNLKRGEEIVPLPIPSHCLCLSMKTTESSITPTTNFNADNTSYSSGFSGSPSVPMFGNLPQAESKASNDIQAVLVPCGTSNVVLLNIPSLSKNQVICVSVHELQTGTEVSGIEDVQTASGFSNIGPNSYNGIQTSGFSGNQGTPVYGNVPQNGVGIVNVDSDVQAVSGFSNIGPDSNGIQTSGFSGNQEVPVYGNVSQNGAGTVDVDSDLHDLNLYFPEIVDDTESMCEQSSNLKLLYQNVFAEYSSIGETSNPNNLDMDIVENGGFLGDETSYTLNNLDMEIVGNQGFLEEDETSYNLTSTSDFMDSSNDLSGKGMLLDEDPMFPIYK